MISRFCICLAFFYGRFAPRGLSAGTETHLICNKKKKDNTCNKKESIKEHSNQLYTTTKTVFNVG
jgi:hypothetical protein